MRSVFTKFRLSVLFRFCLVESAFLLTSPKCYLVFIFIFVELMITDLIMKMSFTAFSFPHQMSHVF